MIFVDEFVGISQSSHASTVLRGSLSPLRHHLSCGDLPVLSGITCPSRISRSCQASTLLRGSPGPVRHHLSFADPSVLSDITCPAGISRSRGYNSQ
jgi:hypothetical protein